MLKFELGHYQIVTRRLAEFSAQWPRGRRMKTNKRSPGLACGYRGARFLTPAASLIFGAYWPVMPDRAPSLGAIFAGRGQNQNPMTEA
jgi:hypothetical protein